MARCASVFLLLLATLALPLAAADVVRFAPGASSARLEGRLTGDQTVEYHLRARAAQEMTVALVDAGDSVYFNVFEPGKKPGQDQALFLGASGGSKFRGSLPASGDYTIQVYQVRSAARRGEAAAYKLDVAIHGAAASAPAGDAKVAGTDFHATGELPCAKAVGQPTGSCRFGVKRHGEGSADVTVFFPDGGQRVIRFEKGAPVSSDAGEKLTFAREADLALVRIGTERFEIIDAIVFGG